MGNLQKLMQEEYERMRRIREITEQRLIQNADITGKLRISAQKNQVSYYQRLPQGKNNGEYIPKKNVELARKLAQKTYDEKVIKLVKKRERQLEAILKDFKSDEIERLFSEENPLRQALIIPAEPTWQQVVEQWMLKPAMYPPKVFSENAPVILSNRKERVRSKSERTIANYFNQHGIPYKYECPIFLPPYLFILFLLEDE